MKYLFKVIGLGDRYILFCRTCGKEMSVGLAKVKVVIDDRTYYIAELFEHCGYIEPVISFFESFCEAKKQGSRVVAAIANGQNPNLLPLISVSLAKNRYESPSTSFGRIQTKEGSLRI